MIKKNSYSIFIGIALFFTSCFISAGTHGSLKGCRYQTKKENLQRAVMTVIKNNANIYRDTTSVHLNKSPGNASNDAKGDYSAGENYYNDIENYVTIKITSGQMVNEYTFRYYGDEAYWKTSESSEIFIAYAFDKEHKGGSEGNAGVTNEMLKNFTDVFEKEFISKIDIELKLQHTDGSD